MQEYDDALKLLLRQSGHLAIRKITGLNVKRWLNIEAPKSFSMRLDLLGETAGGILVHIELQTKNDPNMPLRMAEYCLAVYRLYGRIPLQFCVYVGARGMRMRAELRGPGLQFQYHLIDMRTLDGDELVASPELADNLIAILMHLRDHKDAIRRIAAKLDGLPKPARDAAIGQLRVFAGLRRLGPLVEQEVEKKMPFTIEVEDLLPDKYFGPILKSALKKGRAKGAEEGLEKGLEQGLEQGRQNELKLVQGLIQERFGELPVWARERLSAKSSAQLQKIGIRVLKARSIEQLLK